LQRQYHSLVRHAQLSVPYEHEKIPVGAGGVHALRCCGSKAAR